MNAETITCEIRFKNDPSRTSPGRLTGTLLTYETRASDRPEMFARGSLFWPDNGLVVNRAHDRKSPVVRVVPFVDGDEVKIDTPLPDTQMGRDAATDIREGLLTGLSIEFYPREEGRRAGMREIRRAYIPRAGLVDDPSYTGSTVEVRHQVTARRRLWL